jgi:hypothetical protein
MKEKMTNEEPRKRIRQKISNARPMVKNIMMAHIKRANKLEKARVSRDGWDISID